MHKYKQFLSRLVFLGIFGLTVLAIFWMGRSLSKSQEPALIGTIVDEFVPREAGKVILVEFSDFQCPACRAYYPVVKQLRDEFGDKLILEYKYFPLRNIHKNADISALAGESARLQSKFYEMEELLFTKQDEWAFSGDASSFFRNYAEVIGLDVERFNSDIDSSAVYDRINSDYQKGVSLGVSGTPTFFVNGKKITNPRGYDEFKSIIEQALGN